MAMREFIIYSRTGRTDSKFASLHAGGRLDVVYRCILMSMFKSHGIRKDVVFRAVLNGPPRPPLELSIDGASLCDVGMDEAAWHDIIRHALSGKPHPGVTVRKRSLQDIVSAQKGLNDPRYETLKGIMAAKKKTIPQVTLEELGFASGEPASHVVITGLDVPPQRNAGRILKGDPGETARELAGLLHNEAKVV